MIDELLHSSAEAVCCEDNSHGRIDLRDCAIVRENMTDLRTQEL